MFELDGDQFDLAAIEKFAKDDNKTTEEYISAYGLTEVEPGKTTPTAQGAVVEETAAPESQATESISEDGLLDSQITYDYSIDGEEVTKDEFDQYTALQEKGEFQELINDPNNPKLLEEYEKKEKQAAWNGRIAAEKRKYDDIYGEKDENGNLITDEFGEVKRRDLSSLEKINNSLVGVADRISSFFPKLKITTGVLAEQLIPDELLEDFDKNGKNSLLALIPTVVGANPFALNLISSKTEINDAINELKTREEVTAQKGGTGEISKGFEEGDVGEIAAGVVNGLTSFVPSLVLGTATGGTSTAVEFFGDSYKDYNAEVAKRKGISIEELRDRDEDSVIIPAAISGINTTSELIGLKGVGNAILKNAGAGAMKRVANILMAGNKEGLTEYFQTAVESAQNEYGKTDNLKKASLAYADSFTSKQGLESYLQGFVGGTGTVAIGSTTKEDIDNFKKTASNLRAPSDVIAIEADISELSELQLKLKRARTKTSKEGIQQKINDVNSRLSSRITKSNSIIPKLTKTEIDEVNSMGDLAELQVNRVKALNKELEENKIKRSDYLIALEGYKTTYVNAKNRIKGIADTAETKPEQVVSEEIDTQEQTAPLTEAEQAVQKIIAKEKIASSKVQQIYNDKGIDGINEIFKEFKPIVDRIVDKRRDAPNFDRELLTSEIQVGKRGILDLVNAYPKYVEKQKAANQPVAPLAGFINKQLPNRAIEASQRILGKEFTQDVTEAKAVTATETAEDIVTQQEQVKQEVKTALAKDLNLDETTQNDIVKAVEKTLGTKLPAVTDKKFKQALTTGFRNELTNTFKTVFGRQASYEQFLRDNFEKIYPAIPQETINRNFKEFNEAVIDPETGKQVREKTPEGKNVFKKRDITKAEFLKYFLTEGSNKGARKTSLAKVLADEIGLDNVFGALSKPDIVEKFKAIQELQGQKVPSNFRSIISQAINRIDDLITELDKFEQDKSILRSDFGLSVPAVKVIKLFLKSVKAGLKAGLTIEKAVSNALKNIDKYSKAEKLSPQEQTIVKKAAKSIPAKDYTSKPAKDIINRIDKEYERLFKEEQSKAIDEVLIPLYKDNVKGKTKEQRIELAKEFWTLYWRTFQKIKGTNEKEMYSIINNIFGKDFKFTNKLVDGKKFEPNKIDQSKTARFVEKFKNNKEKTITEQHQQADYNFDKFINLLISLKEKYNNKEISIDSVYFLLKSTGADMNSVGKRIQRLGNNTDIEALNANKRMTLEHNSPFDFTLKNILLPFIINDIKSSKELVNILKLQKLELIDKNKADKLNKTKELNLKTTMPDGYKITDDPIIRLLKIYPDLKKDAAKENATLSEDFNKIIEDKTGIAADKVYKKAKAEVEGASKGKWKFFIPPGAEDFVGLLYATLGKDKLGDQQMAWYKYNLLNPYTDALNNITRDRVQLAKDFKELKKQLKIVPKNLRKKLPGTQYSQQDAVRVYIWNKQGVDMLTEENGMDKADLDQLIKFVEKDPNLLKFADQLMEITQQEYASPGAKWWDAGSIDADLLKTLSTTRRTKYLEESGWTENVNAIFSKDNLNKLEAAYGKSYRIALENILGRMKSGRNRSFGGDALTSRFTDWISNSIGTIMFLNSRSAVLQTISAVNFINWSDNNVLAAAKAFLNPKQWTKDFMMLMNSPFLVERRNGLKIDVNESEIADLAKTSTNKAKAIMGQLLKAGFLPTQIADSFAIASGGASFYRNRFNSLVKEGYTKEEAETIAMRDFRETATESQQSSDPSRISQQQAGPLGRIVLAFANTPAQYARLTKKAVLDIKNGRGDLKTNISKIIYYMVVQNIIFTALQQALFAVAFGDDEEEDEMNKKYIRMANSMSDSILRGLGFAGAAVSVAKNVAIKIAQESDKKAPKFEEAAWKLLEISPPISSKISKFRSAGRQISWNRKEIREKGLSLENPAAMAGAQIIAGATNLPVDRALRKIDNVQNALSEDAEMWQRVALLSGWQDWEIGMKEEKKRTSKVNNKILREKVKREKVKREKVKR